MKIKPGVKIQGAIPQIVMAMSVASEACKLVLGRNYIMTVTSVVDGIHKRQSAHYTGRAFDIRIRDMGGEEARVGQNISAFLGPQFDVIVASNHIHIEWDPKDSVE